MPEKKNKLCSFLLNKKYTVGRKKHLNLNLLELPAVYACFMCRLLA